MDNPEASLRRGVSLHTATLPSSARDALRLSAHSYCSHTNAFKKSQFIQALSAKESSATFPRVISCCSKPPVPPRAALAPSPREKAPTPRYVVSDVMRWQCCDDDTVTCALSSCNERRHPHRAMLTRNLPARHPLSSSPPLLSSSPHSGPDMAELLTSWRGWHGGFVRCCDGMFDTK